MSYIPTYVFKSIYDIDFNKLYSDGKRNILFDIDNTLLSYNELKPTKSLIEFNQKLRKLGFKIYLVTNNNDRRIKMINDHFLIDGYVAKAKKPSSKRIIKYLEIEKLNIRETIGIGDQMLTDILAFNRCQIDSVLVKSIDRTSEHWYTKINRMREKKVLKNILKRSPDKYQEIVKLYKEVKDE